MTLSAPEIWPERGTNWYAAYERHFWQHDWLAKGFRELPRDDPKGEWFFDVDAGPVTYGIGFCGLGLWSGSSSREWTFRSGLPAGGGSARLELAAAQWALAHSASGLGFGECAAAR